jgi:hypothetical protein
MQTQSQFVGFFEDWESLDNEKVNKMTETLTLPSPYSHLTLLEKFHNKSSAIQNNPKLLFTQQLADTFEVVLVATAQGTAHDPQLEPDDSRTHLVDKLDMFGFLAGGMSTLLPHRRHGRHLFHLGRQPLFLLLLHRGIHVPAHLHESSPLFFHPMYPSGPPDLYPKFV